jgi:hypothetical protein
MSEKDLIAEIEALSTDLSGVKANRREINPQEYFFNTIMRKAHERPVTAGDFEEFVGCHNWLLMGRDDMHHDWRQRNDDSQIVTRFELRRVFTDTDVVEIVADIGAPMGDYVAIHFVADELAIRMDAS